MAVSSLSGFVTRHRAVSLTTIALLIVAGVIVLWISHNHHTPASVPPATSHAAAPNQTLTAGGEPVPTSEVARAKKAGYYCPSWDAQPGQVSSGVCLPLDH